MQLEQLLANISNYTSDAIVITDANLAQEGGPKIVYVNDSFTALTGYKREEAIGRSPSFLQGPETDKEEAQRIAEALQKKQPVVAELLNYTKRKHTYWVEISLAPVFDTAGNCVYFIAIEKDITERYVMQLATEQQSLSFLQSEMRARAILNSIVDGIITVNAQGLVERFSPSAERLFGYESADAEGMQLPQFFELADAEKIEAILLAKMHNAHDVGNLSTYSLQGKRASGEVFYAEITCSVMRLGEEKQMVCAVRDVTQLRKAVEDMRHARDAAEAASRAKSEFLANMSHELRTPMNGILGLASILKETVLEQEQRECVEALSGSASTLLNILNDILDLSKIEAGELKIATSPFNLHDMLHHVRDFMAPLASQKGLELEFMQSPDCPSFVVGDVHRLQQIIVNLVGNALKFTEAGHVHVRVYSALLEGDVKLRFEVQDTGIGIAADQCERIFGKFTQVDGSDTRRYGGTGLGLAICRQLVELMEGSIGVQSAVGEGSCFWFEAALPLADQLVWQNEQSEDTIQALEQADVAHARVLVVEDHAINFMLLNKLLRKMGFTHIEHMEHGGQAVQACRRGRYDLVLMDCQMPILDGYEATRRIRMDELLVHQQRTPIIAMTANAMQGDREKCLECGMDDYLSKPIDLPMLRRVLSRWLQVEEGQAPEEAAAPANEAADAVVDMAHLRMFTDGDHDEELQLFSIFMKNAVETYARLLESVDKQDAESWRKAAHRLKGASGNLGARMLSQVCSDAEMAGMQGGEVKVWASFMPAITVEMRRVEQFINQQTGDVIEHIG